MSKDKNVDKDGWGHDAPPVTRTQLEKVQSSYQPTKVDMRELSAQKAEVSRFSNPRNDNHEMGDTDIVKGGYQPVGRVDIAALRKQAQQKSDDRPTAVKGSYEPVGKVDIAAIKARAQQPSEAASPKTSASPSITDRGIDRDEEQPAIPDRTTPSSISDRLTSLPKPKVANNFGPGAKNFTGTKAPTPNTFGLEGKPTPAAPPVGVGRTFADQGGKTPAQIWAERKARERGTSGASDTPTLEQRGSAPHVVAQNSGDFKNSYAGKSWAPVQITRTGQSASSLGQQRTDQEEGAQEEAPASPLGNVGALRDRFKEVPPIAAASSDSRASAPSPPPLEISSKPNIGRGISPHDLPQSHQQEEDPSRLPTPPAQPPRSPTPPTPPAMDSGSPIRVAMPVSRGHNDQVVEDAREEQFSPPPAMPTRSLAQAIPHEDNLTEEPIGHDPARGAAEATAAASFGGEAAESTPAGANDAGKRALVQYDYEKAEDNELELREGEYVTNIEMVDEDWWMGQNSSGESGLFPSNYVELAEGNDGIGGESVLPTADQHVPEPEQHHATSTSASHGATATAMYDYEAAEGNELSFPENATITNVVSYIFPLIFSPLMFQYRNFQTRTGGQVSMEGNKVFSLQTMYD